ncbi:2-oxoglutarate dehydrogenase E1 component [Urbifossiella limnaea]|uniref:oxoglutarate dehydrogenase (succinyl-transferring) n=1 Tax=Urbifossiella limnaea TaxID=2528023 RepID=A0A517XZQ2_9BACT|nr:2-oxoglutarate dehydrogenase E1 component [Urbifossiella limnaea]QDU22990.1 2-oxoglutarate dehydrogenase E1 component [Urbifossiella limnaea]
MTDPLAGPYNRDLLDAVYQQFRADPGSVDPTWRAFFAGMEFAGASGAPTGHAAGSDAPDLRLQTGVVRLVFWYRQAGHLQADIDPLRTEPLPPHPFLRLENFGLSEADLDRTVDASMHFGIGGPARLRDLIAALEDTYCRTVGVEYMHIDSLEVRHWLGGRMEPTHNRPHFPHRKQYRTLFTLHQAELFEKFLHTKYVGQKRFSLEGGETLIPVLDALVEQAPGLGAKELVIGMAHRGRLNVLANVLRKPFEEIFNEFEDNFLPDSFSGDGDVKYHLGFSADIATADGGTVHLSVAPNPSHLEIVNPVVEGRVRAKQRLHGDTERTTGVPILIHGDAAFAGQGVVMETLNLSNLAGYRTGGTVHIVVNNQIGFTTNPRDSRSTEYCTDIAKYIQAPVFHVNAEDPEACVYAAELAFEFRQRFKRDVVIDLVCYRKWGHNEGDEPAFTQPLEYKNIRARDPISKVYSRALVEGPSAFTEEMTSAIETEFHQKLEEAVREADRAAAEYRSKLDQALKAVKSGPPRKRGMEGFSGRWKGLTKAYTHDALPTGAPLATLDRIADAVGSFPEGFTPHEKLRPILEKRRDNIKSRKPVDWGTAESLAFGSLVLEGTAVRLSGQDSRRGTFTHRHAVVIDSTTGAPHYPLANLDPKQAPFEVFDSSLSEMAVMGFEFGYAMDDPGSLVMWEAQFGDFANGAQVVIDQFLTSCESKWNRSNGLVLLLPHGYEGQGPEHSSARLERFLLMCAEDNIQVAYPTTPAQIFHLLRRQVKRSFRKPLIVMTPKSLLRLPAAVSPVEDFAAGGFREVIDDTLPDPAAVTRVVVCSGKVYYDLMVQREKLGTKAVAVVRLEQFYPWPEEQLHAVLSRYRRATEWVWAQEESQNMGGWFFVEPRVRAMGFPFEYVGRDASASPATGSHHAHEVEQRELVEAAFGGAVPHLVALSKPAANGKNGSHAPQKAEAGAK